MNKKGFAISIILYSLVFLLVSIFYMLLGIVKTRYIVSKGLRESVMNEFNESQTLHDKVMKLCNDSDISYVQKYDAIRNGAAVDTVDGSGDEDICYYAGTSDRLDNMASSNANVIFGDYCWQIIRTTAVGGVKLIYNGPKTSDDKCPNDSALRPSTIGVSSYYIYNPVDISGAKKYGTGFEIIDDNGTKKFKLKDANTYSWSDSTYQNIIGKYTCIVSSGISDTCETLYYVGGYSSNTKAHIKPYVIRNNTNYTQIGLAPFNANNNSMAFVGYMFNEVYYDGFRQMYDSIYILNEIANPKSYYYGDKATWNPSTNKYDLTINDGNGNDVTPSTPLSWSSIHEHAKGMYTCKNEIDTSCAVVHYVVANSSYQYMYSMTLSNGEGINDRIVLTGTGFKKENNKYILTGQRQLYVKDWYENGKNDGYMNVYICDDYTKSECDTVYYVANYIRGYYMLCDSIDRNYVYANDVKYVNGEYKLVLDDSTNHPFKSIWQWSQEYTNLSSTHYTCFDNYDAENNSCGDTIFFVGYSAYSNPPYARYIALTNGEKIEDALEQMLNISGNNNNINKYSSAAKRYLENWYEMNIDNNNLSQYLDNSIVFCNDRTIKKIGDWVSTGAIRGPITFKNYRGDGTTNKSLSCSSMNDRFSVMNDNAKLKYPVGMLTMPERQLIGWLANVDSSYMLLSPSMFEQNSATLNRVCEDNAYGTLSTGEYSYGIRPMITLKSDMVVFGKGTYDEPYIVKTYE